MLSTQQAMNKIAGTVEYETTQNALHEYMKVLFADPNYPFKPIQNMVNDWLVFITP